MLLTAPFPNCDIKLCDFGIARHIARGADVREILGTPDYVGKRKSCDKENKILFDFRIRFLIYFLQLFLFFPLKAPEVLNYEPISLATDMW